MHFESPLAFLLFLVLPLLAWFALRPGRSSSLRFSTTANVKQAPKSWRARFIQLPLIIRLLCLALIIVALARPQEGRDKVKDVSRGIAMEMVIDRSGSMSAEMNYDGENLTRLDVVKKVFEEFVSGKGGKLNGRPNDLIGMIAFARYADTMCPLTLAHGALSEFLKSVQLVKRREEDGTAIGDAIALAAARLKTAEETLAAQTKEKKQDFQIKSKIIILLTDGQSNAGTRSPMEAASLAKEWGIKIYSIGVGGAEGLVRQNSIFGNFLVQMGEGVDKQMLTNLATTTGGIFRMAEDAEGLRQVYKEIDALERSEVESIRYLDYREMFQYIAFLALAVLALEIVLNCTVFRKIP